MIFPRKLRQGDSVTAADYNDIVDCLRRFRPIQGAGARVDQTPGGSVISVISQREATGKSDPVLFPFKVRFAPSEVEGASPGDGDFLIYIPSGSLTVDGHSADGIDFGLEARDGEDGWYVLPAVSQDSEWWVSFEYEPKADYPLLCMLVTEPPDDGDDHGSIVRNIHVADIDLEDGESPKVKQISRGPFTYEFFVESVNGLKGEVEVAADPEASVNVDGQEVYASVTTDGENGTILVGITTEKPDDPAAPDNDPCSHPGGGIGVDAPHSGDGVGSEVDRAGVKAEGTGSDTPSADCCGN